VSDEQVDRLAMLGLILLMRRNTGSCLAPLAPPPHVLIKFDQQECLILHIREQAILPDEVENARPSQAKVVGNGLARLLVCQVELDQAFHHRA
jgi:hypothetical protein